MSRDSSAPLPFAELLLAGARAQPDRDCIVMTDDRVTYGELAGRATMAGRSLLALGVERGDRVGILMANCLDFTDVLFGASLIGAVPVLYNARFKPRGDQTCHRRRRSQGHCHQRHHRAAHQLCRTAAACTARPG